MLVSDCKSNTFSQSLYFRHFKSRNPFGFAAFKMVEMAGVEPLRLGKYMLIVRQLQFYILCRTIEGRFGG